MRRFPAPGAYGLIIIGIAAIPLVVECGRPAVRRMGRLLIRLGEDMVDSTKENRRRRRRRHQATKGPRSWPDHLRATPAERSDTHSETEESVAEATTNVQATESTVDFQAEAVVEAEIESDEPTVEPEEAAQADPEASIAEGIVIEFHDDDDAPKPS